MRIPPMARTFSGMSGSNGVGRAKRGAVGTAAPHGVV
jgi:hypothetical protein